MRIFMITQRYLVKNFHSFCKTYLDFCGALVYNVIRKQFYNLDKRTQNMYVYDYRK